jgi:hypothetical protein
LNGFLLGLFGLCAALSAILHLIMIFEMRDNTGRWLLAFNLFVDKGRFTERGRRIRRWRFIVFGVAIGCLLIMLARES